MPHYTDGTLAKIGDQVIGKLYNSGPNEKAGTIISITPNVESCNAMVQFTEAKLMESNILPEKPRMALSATDVRVVKGEQHGSSGPTFILFTCVDYCAINELTKIGS